jgi:hypothetical protein
MRTGVDVVVINEPRTGIILRLISALMGREPATYRRNQPLIYRVRKPWQIRWREAKKVMKYHWKQGFPIDKSAASLWMEVTPGCGA